MTLSTTPRATAAALLAHESFVRAVVRGVLHDDDAVQDVLQETWLRALRRGPREERALRPWLARVARNVAHSMGRASRRRGLREREVARSEATDSTERAAERLAARREVADAVLALEEPYRGLLLMRYEEGLAPGAIAARLGRSSATVRSQLSRAHARLRERLDRSFEGGTRAWGALLLRLPRAGVASAVEGLAPWLAASVLGVGAAAWVGFGLLGRSQTELRMVPLETPVSAAVSAALPGSSSVVLPAPRSARAPARVVGGAGQDGSRSERRPRFEDQDVAALRTLAHQVQVELEAKLLAVPESSATSAPDGAGVVRLLSGAGLGALANVTWSEGGGSYFSFATGRHDYQAEPDLSFRGGRFESGFYGGQLGLLLGLGGLPLAEVPADGDRLPPGLAAEREDAWRRMWSELDFDRARSSELSALGHELARTAPRAAPGETYALRSFSEGEHDLLAAFSVLAVDERGCTIAWRVLTRFPDPGDTSGVRAERPLPPSAPEWMRVLSTEELLALLGELRSVAVEKLFVVPEPARARFAELVRRSSTSFADRAGFARILHRGQWGSLVEAREGGAYFSFLTGANDYDDQPDLGLEQRRFSSGFAGNDTGLLLDLGEVPFTELAAVFEGAMPSTLNDPQREVFEWLRTLRAQFDPEQGRRALSAEVRARVDELGLRRGVPALLGHSYVLRAALFESHDHLVVFTVIDEDVAGMSLAWRVMRSWPVER